MLFYTYILYYGLGSHLMCDQFMQVHAINSCYMRQFLPTVLGSLGGSGSLVAKVHNKVRTYFYRKRSSLCYNT